MDSSIRSSEIVAVLKREIERFAPAVETADIGEVIQCGDGIAQVYGLDSVVAGELVRVEAAGGEPVTGIALNLEEDSVGVVLLDESDHVKEGDVVRRTGAVAQVPAGEALLGRVVDPLGRPLDGGPAVEASTRIALERKAPGIVDRTNVCEPLFTGLKAIDALVPIGRGQRELIIGDRRTGKTAIAIDAIINQALNAGDAPVYCFYVAIGQKRSTVARVVEKLRETGALRYTTVVSATASDTAPLQYIAPYAGCAMAEYFRDSGRHALIVYDDLTKHAQAYRQISLLLRRPPGREAYPGDIFYLHSRLLERAAKLSDVKGGGSLTALPIVETQAGDISAYIPTNIISITDGQIFLETNLFNSGLRPAINVGMSVSRVGGAAQIKAMKQVAGSLRLELAQFRELAAFSQFASELDKVTLAQLDRGERLTEILKQKQYRPLDIMHQIMILYAGTHGYLDKYPAAKLAAYERHLQNFLDMKYVAFMKKLRAEGAFTDAIDAEARAVLDDFATMFNPDLALDSLDATPGRGLAMAVGQTAGPSRREMLQVIERAAAKELVSPSLEDDLEKMMEAREAGGENKDRFDAVVETCTIIDIKDKLERDALFRRAAEILAPKVNVDAATIVKHLAEREESSSTALTPLFAVPHMIVPGEKVFTILVVRCVAGVSFGPHSPDVHAIFFLVGSIDERSFHLLALAAIAQIVNSPGFGRRWMAAAGVEDLRAIMLSAKRKRAG